MCGVRTVSKPNTSCQLLKCCVELEPHLNQIQPVERTYWINVKTLYPIHITSKLILINLTVAKWICANIWHIRKGNVFKTDISNDMYVSLQTALWLMFMMYVVGPSEQRVPYFQKLVLLWKMYLKTYNKHSFKMALFPVQITGNHAESHQICTPLEVCHICYIHTNGCAHTQTPFLPCVLIGHSLAPTLHKHLDL